MNALEAIATLHLRHIYKCFFINTNIAISEKTNETGEIDAIGLSIDNKKIYICEATMTYPPYGGGNKLEKKIRNKFNSAVEFVNTELKYFLTPPQSFTIEIEFWAPAISSKSLKDIESLEIGSEKIKIKVIDSEKFTKNIKSLKAKLSNCSKQFLDPAGQILGLIGFLEQRDINIKRCQPK